ncbi:MAG TPA: sulfatase-like hydrolase/transferase, partial [Thermoanaerobaculia bacterium]
MKTLVAAGVLISFHSCGTHGSRANLRNANILIITLDTTRADHLGAYGYAAAQTPNEDALAREGVVFEEAITPTAYTLPSHSSIMTGLYPPAHGVRINGEAALADTNTTLAERLAAKGYRTGAFVAAFVLDGRWGLSQGFQNYDDHFNIAPDQKLELAGVRRPGNEVVDAAIKWLDQPGAQPFFAWVHLYDAHAPYRNNRYDDGISFADSQVGRLIAYLEQRHIRNRTLIVITGDHGEGLGSHGEQEHGYYIYDATVHVPLLIDAPGIASGVRVKSQVRTIDIVPTVMDLVAGERLNDVQGQSLVPLMNGESEKTPRYAYSESMAVRMQYGWSALYGLRTNEYKFIDAPRSELYELRSDPAETANKLDDQRRIARDLMDRLKAVRDESAKRAPKTEEANIDQETMKKLASLGYLGGGGSSANTADDKSLPDPKDKMHLYDSVGYAASLISKNDYAGAAKVLEIVLKDDPNVPQAQMLFVSALRATHQSARAQEILDAFLKRNPSDTHALIAMAELLDEQGKSDEVLAICKRALSVDPKDARAYEVMAEVYMNRNDHRDALPLLQKAVEIQPKLNRSRLNLAVAAIGVGQTDQAGQILTEIVQQYPKFPFAH